MKISRLRAKFERNEPAIVTTIHFTDESVIEMASLMGFDAIWLDLEHHATSVETAARMMRAARVGTSDIVARPAKGEFLRMGRLLEAGAQAIMYPQCDDAKEAAEVVHWAKFPPVGRRGFDGANGDAPYLSLPMREYTQQANRETLVIIQIETAQALDNVEEIAAVPGVDVVMMGPADLSLQLGVPGEFEHPKMFAAMERIAAAANAATKVWGRTAGTIDDVARYVEAGARFICYGADIVMVKQGLETMQRDLSELGFRFENRLA